MKEQLIIEEETTRKPERSKRLIAVLSFLLFLSLTAIILLAVLGRAGARGTGGTDEVVVVVVQMNDVYEITPVNGRGGLSRVAGIVDEARKRTPYVFTVLAGDLISPSALNEANVSYGGVWQLLRGRQMIDIMNRIPIDVACFGNHEFDYSNLNTITQRVNESKFVWLRGNVEDANGNPFLPTATQIRDTHTLRVDTSPPISIGLLSVSIELSQPYVKVSNLSVGINLMQKQLEEVDMKNAHATIALTHVSLQQDIAVLASVGVDVVMGGHEHENFQLWRASNKSGMHAVFKSDANAASVYVHDFIFKPNPISGWTLDRIQSKLVSVDSSSPVNPDVESWVKFWHDLGFDGFRANGVDPAALVATTPIQLDGRSSTVRYQPTELTSFLCRGMMESAQRAGPSTAHTVAAFMNSGGVRIDDIIPANYPITVYDVMRILPLGGRVEVINISGSLLVEVLNQGLQNVGSGGYLAYYNIRKAPGASIFQIINISTGEWVSIDSRARYTVATTTYLLTGKESGLSMMGLGARPNDLSFITTAESWWDATRKVFQELWG